MNEGPAGDRSIDVQIDADITISMDGKGAWRDNRMIERLWRSLKYECVYLNAFDTGSEMRAGIGKWLIYYNAERPHSKPKTLRLALVYPQTLFSRGLWDVYPFAPCPLAYTSS
jgi:transposase InsO family protein